MSIQRPDITDATGKRGDGEDPHHIAAEVDVVGIHDGGVAIHGVHSDEADDCKTVEVNRITCSAHLERGIVRDVHRGNVSEFAGGIDIKIAGCCAFNIEVNRVVDGDIGAIE